MTKDQQLLWLDYKLKNNERRIIFNGVMMKGVANKKCNTLQQNCKQKRKDKNNNQKKRLKA
jgi:hypothetical protein